MRTGFRFQRFRLFVKARRPGRRAFRFRSTARCVVCRVDRLAGAGPAIGSDAAAWNRRGAGGYRAGFSLGFAWPLQGAMWMLPRGAARDWRGTGGAKHVVVVALLLLLAGGVGCHRSGGRIARDSAETDEAHGPSATAGFVPDQQCRDCHTEICDSFHQIGMGRSFDVRPIELAGEDFADNHYYHAPSDRHYEMIREGDDLYQVRYQTDASGARVNELKVRVDAVIGSGNHARTYLYRTPSGEMFQMPLGWFAEGRVWRMNPGYDRADHPGFGRKINRECMFCHNAYPTDVPAEADDFWQPDVFPDRLPEGIGCQRCHGPGGRHVDLALSLDSGDPRLSSSIVNPAGLPPARRDDVCLQCHLQPSAQIWSIPVRMGRDDYSFRAGQDLSDYRAFVDYFDPSEGDRFEINHHAYRLAQSPCMAEDGRPLSCLDCHDPHAAIPQPQRVGHYRAKCIACHDVQECGPASEIESQAAAASIPEASSQTRSGDAVADCVHCHMPRRRAWDAVHAVMTDHRIVRQSVAEAQRLAARDEPPPP
ncbi:MAG: hypothetical protein D6753_15215, partial [Planctomycetota bacterium]